MIHAVMWSLPAKRLYLHVQQLAQTQGTQITCHAYTFIKHLHELLSGILNMN